MRGGKRAAGWACAVLGACALSHASAAHAQSVQAPSPAGADEAYDRSVALGLLIRDGRWDEAQAILDRLTPDQRATADVRFVEAFIARQRGMLLHAIELYQRMLDDDAMLGRVRFELAQTFVELGDDRAAEQNFRLALTGALPPEARTLIEAALTQIERRQRWRYSVSFAVAPDSNVNAATSAETAEIFGLPFELSDEARRTSGFNVTAALGAERAFEVTGPWSVLAGAGVRGTDNEGAAFDDYAVNGRLGVQRVSGGLRSELSAIGDRRWFGGEPLSQTWGADARQRISTGRTVYDLGLSALRLDYDLRDDRDAWVYGADISRTRYVTPDFFWRAGLGLRRADAETRPESFWGVRASAGAYRTVVAGFGLWVQPSVEWREFDAASFAFGVVRSDFEASIAVRGIKHDLRLFGYSPYAGVEFARNDSNVELESYDRVRFEVGVTRTF